MSFSSVKPGEQQPATINIASVENGPVVAAIQALQRANAEWEKEQRKHFCELFQQPPVVNVTAPTVNVPAPQVTVNPAKVEIDLGAVCSRLDALAAIADQQTDTLQFIADRYSAPLKMQGVITNLGDMPAPGPIPKANGTAALLLGIIALELIPIIALFGLAFAKMTGNL